jgi:NADPH:quinone reductase-like Zn-dependent oxidoreductase
VLESSEVELPLPGRGDVLVQVGAASVHPGDYFVMTGVPYVVRLAFGLRRPRHGIPGRDFAGVVAAVGKDVTALRPGDEVFGWSTAGTLAEYARVPADNLVSVPANLSVVEAAAVPASAMAALQALRDIANVRPGQAHREALRRHPRQRDDRTDANDPTRAYTPKPAATPAEGPSSRKKNR